MARIGKREECFVYVLAVRRGEELSGPVKVGVSGNPRARLAELQTACPYDLLLLKQFEAPNRAIASQIEDCFHCTQSQHRLRGEWFDMAASRAVELLRFQIMWCLKQFAAGLTDEEMGQACEMMGVANGANPIAQA